MSKPIEAIRPENKELAAQIIAQMQAGVERWEMPWHQGIVEAVNVLTGRVYTGYNATVLWQEGMARNYTSNKWATLKQWRKFKGMVRRGAKGVALLKPLIRTQHYKDGTSKDIVYAYKRYYVFNYAEINNVNFEHPDLFASGGCKPFEFNKSAELIVSSSQAVIKHGETKAFYSPLLDYIGMPDRQNFFATKVASASENYYSTLLHELIHWTKKIGRSPREYGFETSQQDYAFEELVAELGASILTTRVHGLVQPREDHAAYLKGWLAILEDDFDHFYRAMQLAQKASDWLCEKAGLEVDRDGWHFSGQIDVGDVVSGDVVNDVADDEGEDGEILAVINVTEPNETVRKPVYLKPPKGSVRAARYHHYWTVGSFNWLVRTDITCASCRYMYSVVLKLDTSWSSCSRCGVYNCFKSVNDLYPAKR